MERKQFSFSFSIPSFLKRVKTENASGENIPGSSSVETQKNDQLPSGSGCQPANPFRSPSIRAPPSSPRIPPKTMDIFATPRRPVPSNTQETLPQSNTPRPSTYAGRGGLVTRSSRDSPVPTIFSLKRRGIQPIASSVEDVQVEESSLSKRAIGLPPGNVRKEMASPRNVFPLRLNLGPRSSPLKQKTSPSLAPISPTEVQPLRTEPAVT